MMRIGNITIDRESPLVFILGPCVIESEEMAIETAHYLKENSPFPFIFKASYDKANRTSLNSFRGPGRKDGLYTLQAIKERFDIPITTDIHHPEEAKTVAEVSDLLQIPAFLARQTDLILAAADTGLPVNVKKGQFLSPYDTKSIVEKIASRGNSHTILTERGTTFGYNNLVVDMRSFSIMKSFTPYVCFDASHSVQLPGAAGDYSGGERQFILPLAKAAIGLAPNLVFIQTHPHPNPPKSDSLTQWPLYSLIPLLEELSYFYQMGRSYALTKS